MKTVAFLTLGCKVNSYETNGMEKLFRESGYEIKDFSDKADVYVVNTCTITSIADRKSRQMLHRAKKQNPAALIVAAGCYVQASKEEAEQDTAIDLVIGNNQKSRIVELVEAYQSQSSDAREAVCVKEMKTFLEFEDIAIETAGEKTRAYIKIQDGCNQFCSYCIIPYVRGRIRSRGEEAVIKEVRSLVEKGYQEVVLTGIHLSSYGVDASGEDDFVRQRGAPLAGLIERVSEIEGLRRIRLGSLEPRIITEEFADRLARVDKLCPHFHLSLQSGCDETLLRMNRKYCVSEYLDKCKLLRRYFDRPAITTDIIVGFPMETEEEFLKTREFMKEVGFFDVHIFKYSIRKGTRAAQMDGQVEEAVKARRSNELIALGRELRLAYEESFLGSPQWVLFEEKVNLYDKEKQKEEEYWVGYSEHYLKVGLPAAAAMEREMHNSLEKVWLTKKRNKDIILSDCIFAE